MLFYTLCSTNNDDINDISNSLAMQISLISELLHEQHFLQTFIYITRHMLRDLVLYQVDTNAGNFHSNRGENGLLKMSNNDCNL